MKRWDDVGMCVRHDKIGSVRGFPTYVEINGFVCGLEVFEGRSMGPRRRWRIRGGSAV